MSDDTANPGNGEEQTDRSLEANKMLEAFVRIRDDAKRRILVELIHAIADDQSDADGGG